MRITRYAAHASVEVLKKDQNHQMPRNANVKCRQKNMGASDTLRKSGLDMIIIAHRVCVCDSG
jgi:hypothetical protein